MTHVPLSTTGAREAGRGLPGLIVMLRRATVDNPVLVKEFRTRMRGSRAYWILLVYTMLLAGVLALMYSAYEASFSSRSAYGDPESFGATELGRNIYYFVFIAQAVMVALITPALTAGAITIEREQRSYDLLVTTPLRPVDLIRGKLSAAVSFVVLLLTASLPLVSLSFLVGGVSPGEILAAYAMVAVSALLFGAIGLFWSSALRTTAAATVVTYLCVLVYFWFAAVPGFLGFAIGQNTAGIGAAPEVPYQSLSALTATFRGLLPEYFFQQQIPSWLPGLILNLIAAVYVATMAMNCLEHFEPPRVWWGRLLGTILWLTFSLFLYAAILGGVTRGWTLPRQAAEHTAGLVMTHLILSGLLMPVLNSGNLVLPEGRSPLRVYLGGLMPHRLLGNNLPNGWPLSLVWLTLPLLLVPLGAYLQGKWSLMPLTTVWLPGAALCFAVAYALAGLGHAFSAWVPSRWAACLMTYVIGALLLIFPYFIVSSTVMNDPRQQRNVLWNLLYLSPLDSLWNTTLTPNSVTSPRLALAGIAPNWVVTVALLAIVGTFGFCVMLRQVAGLRAPEPASEGGAVEDVPEPQSS